MNPPPPPRASAFSVVVHRPSASFEPVRDVRSVARTSGTDVRRHRDSLPIVLVVDDDPLVRSFVRAALEGTAAVVEASDGEYGLRVLEQRRGHGVDLALIDQVLPKLSGLEVLRLVRWRWPWVPVVIITGFGSEELAISALRAGARDYVRKPIQLDRLQHTVAALTAGSSLGSHPIVHVLVEERVDTAVDTGHAVHRGIRRALTFADEHFAERITLTEAAREASLSKFHFCRLFHQETGVSFTEHLQTLRVRRAKALLADRSLTVTEVAYGAGFNDVSHFDRVFKRIAGVSPTEYRKAIPVP